ncbi:hypothetical protein [Paraburkholderia aspalathi]|uniref:hypothetical protein n=1 Tax=Paraburkholderia aspalathi TaxID=1324617 RepID=UPI0038B8B598
MMHMNRTTNALSDESDAIRRELNAHNAAQRARYRARCASKFVMHARQQGRTHLTAVGVA